MPHPNSQKSAQNNPASPASDAQAPFDLAGWKVGLSVAAKSGDEQAVKAFIRHGLKNKVDFHSFALDANHPLYAAAAVGSAECVRHLMRHWDADSVRIGGIGAYKAVRDKSSGNPKGLTPFLAAATKNHVNCLEALLPDCDPERTDGGSTALMFAAEFGAADALRFLIPRVNVNAKNEDGETALMLAALNDNDLCVKFLLQEGRVDANAMDNDGRTALMRAVASGVGGLAIDHLLAASNLDIVDKNGFSILHHAADVATYAPEPLAQIVKTIPESQLARHARLRAHGVRGPTALMRAMDKLGDAEAQKVFDPLWAACERHLSVEEWDEMMDYALRGTNKASMDRMAFLVSEPKAIEMWKSPLKDPLGHPFHDQLPRLAARAESIELRLSVEQAEAAFADSPTLGLSAGDASQRARRGPKSL